MATSTPDGPQRYSRSAVAIEMPATNMTALIAGGAGVWHIHIFIKKLYYYITNLPNFTNFVINGFIFIGQSV